MTPRRYIDLALVLWPAAVGFVVGALIAFKIAGTDLDPVEMTMALVSAGIGALAGMLASMAVRAKNRRRALLTIGGGAGACVVVGLVMIAYRWIIG